jgi:DNA-binding transcriptional regulator YiaG
MRNGEIEKLRVRLGLDRHVFARFLGLTNYGSMMNIENGVRNPSRLAMKVLRYIASLSKKDALAFIEELNRHEPK